MGLFSHRDNEYGQKCTRMINFYYQKLNQPLHRYLQSNTVKPSDAYAMFFESPVHALTNTKLPRNPGSNDVSYLAQKLGTLCIYVMQNFHLPNNDYTVFHEGLLLACEYKGLDEDRFCQWYDITVMHGLGEINTIEASELYARLNTEGP